ncbi:ABC transporter permease [Lichenibacterium minor]|uniref:ABC transporter permease n=1 Tax=Lichenibacterium minor TaxID=2316528 RepID=A0A4Q2U7S7_9HYPH|nr:ABC transporter permease [Lichenibacterium minor]RYC30925.1 ABC transporter permease [Lichenibacterium minor]
MAFLDGVADAASRQFPAFLSGLGITIELLAVSTAVGLALAVPIALARLSTNPLLSVPATAYAYLFRGTPLLVQIFIIYYGLPQFDVVRTSAVWPLLRDPLPCALIAFSLNMAAYTGEVVRGGILAVPAGEREAASAVGMNRALALRRVILPRAFRIALPALSNEVVLQLKATSLASTVTLIDLTGVGRRLAAKTYTAEGLYVAGAVYIVLTFAIARGFRLLEARLDGARTR